MSRSTLCDRAAVASARTRPVIKAGGRGQPVGRRGPPGRQHCRRGGASL